MTDAAAPRRRGRIGRFFLRTILLVVVPVAVALVALHIYARGGRYVETENAYVKANVIAITPEVSGRVEWVGASDNGTVAAGEALFRIDEGSEWLRVGQVLRFGVGRLPRDNAVPVPYQAVYGSGRIYRLEDGRMGGREVETLGSFIDEAGEERLLVHAPELKSGDLLVVTHLPNAIDGLRVEAVGPEVKADTPVNAEKRE